MKWNEKTVHAIVFDRETQQRTRQILSPKEIVNAPIGKETEVIIMAVAKIVSELVEYKEAELERIGELQKRLQAQALNQTEMSV